MDLTKKHVIDVLDSASLDGARIVDFGQKNSFAFLLMDGDPLRLIIKDSIEGVVEGPVPDGPFVSTFWDSRNHNLTYATESDVLDAIAAAYGKMDHRVGHKEEWYATPLKFNPMSNTLVERIKQPGWRREGVQNNNSNTLVGKPGEYGLRICVGGWAWTGGISYRGLEEASILMGKPSDDMFGPYLAVKYVCRSCDSKNMILIPQDLKVPTPVDMNCHYCGAAQGK